MASVTFGDLITSTAPISLTTFSGFITSASKVTTGAAAAVTSSNILTINFASNPLPMGMLVTCFDANSNTAATNRANPWAVQIITTTATTATFLVYNALTSTHAGTVLNLVVNILAIDNPI